MNDPLIWFELRSSWVLTAILGAMHAMAFTCLALSNLPIPVTLIVALAVALSACNSIARHGLRFHRDCVVDVRIDSTAVVWYRLRSGSASRLRLCRDSYQHRWVIVLTLVCDKGKAHRIFLARTMVDRDALGRVRVLLRTYEWPSEP